MGSLFKSKNASGGRGARALRVGLDLGTRRFKAVGLPMEPHTREVAFAIDVPASAGVQPDALSGDPSVFGRELGGVLGGPLPAGSEVSVVLPSSALRVRRVTLAAMDQSSTIRALAQDAVLRVPGVDPAGHHYDFHVLDTPQSPVGGTRSILAVAADRRVVRAAQDAILAAGYVPGRMGVLAVSLANLHSRVHANEAEAGQRVVLIHVGHMRTELILLDGGTPVFTHEALFGMHALVERARRTLPDYGYGAIETMLGEGDATIPAEVFGEWVARAQQELRLTLGAAARDGGGSSDPAHLLAIRLSGGAARSAELRRQLEVALGRSVSVLDADSEFDVPAGDRATYTPALAAALGVVLHPGDGGRLVIDMRVAAETGGKRKKKAGMPPPEVGRTLLRDRVGLGVVAAAVVLAFAVPAVLGGRLEARTAELGERRAALAVAAEALEADEGRVQAIRTEQDRLSGTLGTIRSLEAGRYTLPQVMDAAAKALPQYAWLEAVEMDPAPLGGEAAVRVHGFAPSLDAVNVYEKALRGSGLFSRMELSGSQGLEVGGIPVVRFSISGSVRGPEASVGYTLSETPVQPAQAEVTPGAVQ